ncbi:DEAD/DEAH box helicase [Solitalea longa]|uniref:DEAD/DEAH box helicase n=1 Tax=Solitalea longa TaxID=2079460 RepID=A0A2S4ZZ35_9SPHI|nr:DEAD/DEAH box helicase [Solitalea longa]POY35202.1 DEAD/DEAH box helicase [Solitalea longa]
MSKTFEDFQFNRQILNAIEEAGYTSPTLIQQKAITPILSGNDLMGIAQTGTGKTAAYVLPMVMKLKYAQGQNPRALILVPTRELALQVLEATQALAKYTDLRITAIFGGLGPKTQIETIKSGVDVIIATPGRFMEIYLKEELIVKQLNYFVIDEADKMMDMGFLPQIHKILEIIPRKRQNLLFSATMHQRVETLAGDFLKFPVKVEVTQQATPAETVSQALYYVPNLKSKINLMMHLLKDEEDISKLIVFTKTKTTADNIAKYLVRRFGEEQVRVIHANKGQNSRINAINQFKNDDIRILVATDVAARGLDVSDVSHVINFDVPLIYEDYVHRIGRTGRANKTGDAITFCNEAEKFHIEKIQKLIRQQIPVIEIPQGVFVEETAYDERQAMAREIDEQKRKADPDFKGAFHEKKNPFAKKAEKTKKDQKRSYVDPKSKEARFGPKDKNKGKRR